MNIFASFRSWAARVVAVIRGAPEQRPSRIIGADGGDVIDCAVLAAARDLLESTVSARLGGPVRVRSLMVTSDPDGARGILTRRYARLFGEPPGS